MKVFYGVFVVLCISLVYIQMTSITEITPNSIKNTGSTARLTCNIFDQLQFNISWIKINKENDKNSVVLAIGNIILVNDSRVSTRQDIVFTKYYGINRYTLEILDLKETDAGVYRCELVDNFNVTISADSEIRISTPPTIYNVTKSLVIRHGEPLKLECYANGVPIPSIVWRRESDTALVTNELFHRGNVLEFPTVQIEDRGLYYCDAINGVGKNAFREIDVVVEFHPFLTSSKYIHKQPFRRFVNLDCRVEAYPRPSIEWIYNGLKLYNNQYTKIINNESSEEVTVSILTITKRKDHQSGKYYCKASNTMGTGEIYIIIREN